MGNRIKLCNQEDGNQEDDIHVIFQSSSVWHAVKSTNNSLAVTQSHKACNLFCDWKKNSQNVKIQLRKNVWVFLMFPSVFTV